MPEQQHSLSVEEVMSSLQKRHGLGDNLPTLAGLAELISKESEELEVGKSRLLLRPLIVKINLATSREILGRLGDGCGVEMHRDYGTITHPQTDDPLVSDLDRVQAINFAILDGRHNQKAAGQLQILAKRVKAKAQELAHESSAGVVSEIEQAGTVSETPLPALANDQQATDRRPLPISDAIQKLPAEHRPSLSTVKADCKSGQLRSKRKSNTPRAAYLVSVSDLKAHYIPQPYQPS